MVSVIIPYYKAEKWIETTVRSCLDQGSYLLEIIIVDDEQSIASETILSNIKKLDTQKIALFHNPNKGGNSARNFGFSKAKGAFIQWLDADDLLLPGKFEAQIRKINETNADICYSDWRIDQYKLDQKQSEQIKKHQEYDDFCEQLLLDNWTSPNNYLLTYAAAKLGVENNGWNPVTKVGQDREYFTVLALLNCNFVYQAGVFAVYNKWTINSVSGMDFKMRLELNQSLENRFYRLIEDNVQNTVKINRYKRIIYTHHIKALYYHRELPLSYKFSVVVILWNQIHWKMRLLIPFIYIIKRFTKQKIENPS